MPPPRLIPVIDLKDQIVVRGVGGRRSEYRPIISRLTTSVEPVPVARALLDAARSSELYVADLNAIAGAPPAWQTYRALLELTAELWVDAGVREATDARKLADVGIANVVCGLETLSGPRALRATMEELGPQRVIFSLDLRAGKLLGNVNAWSVQEDDVLALLQQAHLVGVRRLIVLDLAHVGAEDGLKTMILCRKITATFPTIEVFTGGGLRNLDEWDRWRSAGIAGILTASALHSGNLLAAKT